MNLENVLWLAGIVVEAVLIGELGYRRAWRTLPAFCLLVTWDFLTAAGNYIVYNNFFDKYLTFYIVEISISSVLEFCVLVELSWSVLRPIRGSLTRKALFLVAGLILLAGLVIWPFSDVSTGAEANQHLLIHIVQTVGLLRIGFFVLLAATSQWLSIGWRDRELQIATGLGFYSIVSLLAAFLRSHNTSIDQLRLFNQVVVGSYLCSLLYWIIGFAQKEAQRREFTPQMQSLLLAVAGAARANRDALSDSRSQGRRDS